MMMSSLTDEKKSTTKETGEDVTMAAGAARAAAARVAARAAGAAARVAAGVAARAAGAAGAAGAADDGRGRECVCADSGRGVAAVYLYQQSPLCPPRPADEQERSPRTFSRRTFFVRRRRTFLAHTHNSRIS